MIKTFTKFNLLLVLLLLLNLQKGWTQIISSVAGNGTSGFKGDGGSATNASIWALDVTFDKNNNLYIADYYNNAIRKVNASDGKISTIAGTGNGGSGSLGGGLATSTPLNGPADVAIDGNGNLYIYDIGNYCTWKVNASDRKINKLESYGSWGSSGMDYAVDLTVDAQGNLYMAKSNRIRKFTNGEITTVAGNGTAGFSGDGGLAINAQVSGSNIAIDAAGNIYISGNNRIRKINASDGKINTIAGTGTAGYSGDGGFAINALINGGEIAVDGTGNIYLTDSSNNRIRKINASDGKINTIAGNGPTGFTQNNGTAGNCGDGGLATNASFNILGGIAVDASQNIYVADIYNYRIRKIAVLNEAGPAITSQPQAAIINTGESTGFTVIAEGTDLTYQWQVSQDGGNTFSNIYNNHIYRGATTGTLSLTLVPTTMNGYQYRVRVSNYGIVVTSKIVVLTVQEPVTFDNTKPTITTQPKATTITGGQNASFTVVASGEGITYQWQEKRGDGDFVNISNSMVYSGVTSATLTLSTAPISMNGYQYRVILSSGETTISNTAALTIQVPAFTNSGVWQAVGSGQVSTKGGSYPNIAVDASGTPFIVYQDEANGYKATVKKFNGSSWVTVGTAGFSAGQANNTRIALDANGTLFVAYADEASSEKATVKKFNGSNWVDVGNTGFSTGGVDYINLVLDSNGLPLVAYMEKAALNVWDIENGEKATVMKFNGTSWVNVGNAGFSTGRAHFVSMALDANDTPYVAYSDNANNNKATVKKFNGSNWETVGVSGFSPESAPMISIAVDGNGTPYVAFMDYTFGSYDKMNQMATVMKFNGRIWVTVGEARFSKAGISSPSIALDASGTPFVAYSDIANGQKITVKKFDGNNWVDVGNSGFSSTWVWYTSFALDSNGIPVVAYTGVDYANGHKAAVMKFSSDRNSPIITGITEDTGVSNTDKITYDQNLMISGTAEPSALIQVYQEETALPRTVTTNSEGKWKYDYTSTTLEEGTHTFTASAAANGKNSALSGAYTITVDVTKPAVPAKLNFVTNQEHLTPPTINGSAEARSTVKLYYGTVEVGSALADNAGNWKIAIGTPLTEGTYSFSVIATDAAGNISEPSQIEYVHHINEAPKEIILSQSELDENNQIESIIGTISSIDQDADDSHTYTLVPGNGDADNSSFTIDGNILKAAKVFDYEEKNSFHIRIQTQDSGGLTYETTKVITINDVQESTIPLTEENENVKVGPNPANVYLLISSETVIDYITLVNIYGGSVLGKEGNSKQIRLNIESLESGVYTALVHSNGKVSVRRIVVVK